LPNLSKKIPDVIKELTKVLIEDMRQFAFVEETKNGGK